ILSYATEITKNTPEKDDFFLITPIHISMGEIAYGISAGHGELHLTIRSWDLKLMDEKCDDLIGKIRKVCEKYGISYTNTWTQVFFANVNNVNAIKIIKDAAKNKDHDQQTLNVPFKWGEDFGLFTQKYCGAMFGLGAGENTPALHNPDYDFPDEITKTGIDQFMQIIKEIYN
ncbi:MAG: amidohydrolase, partial [Bacteroidia bacterium]|nr:amidohydrolase [Bacteroidia bacterium]